MKSGRHKPSEDTDCRPEGLEPVKSGSAKGRPRTFTRAVRRYLIGDQGQCIPTLTAVLLICAAIPLAGIYANNPSVKPQHRAMPAFAYWWAVHLRAAKDWFTWDETALRRSLLNRDMPIWDTLVLRTALARWRVRHEWPGLFRNVINRWQRGIWPVPDLETWTRMLEELDERWIAARRQAKTRSMDPPDAVRPAIAASDGGLMLVFPLAPKTGALGSMLTVVADVPPDRVPSHPRAAWCLNGSGTVGHRVLLGHVERMAGGSAGLQRIRMTWDFAAEPLWLNPTNRLTRIDLFEPLSPSQIQAVQFSDSPRLMP